MRGICRIGLLAVGVLLWAGCATARIDWNGRVGQYSYDEAISELGVPDRSATLSDGTVVAEWLQNRGGSYGTLHAFPGSRWASYDVNEFPDQYLRLVFSSQRQLIRTEKFYR